MTSAKPLPSDALYQRADIRALDFATTAELPALREVVGQQRAVNALHFGVGMRRPGYNLYVLGPPGVGKQTVVTQYLQTKIAEEPPPSDWCYLNNFREPNKPHLVRLPAGKGARLRRDLRRLVDELLVAIPAAFESEEFQARAKEIEQAFEERQEQALSALRADAHRYNIALLRTPAGFAFAPLRNDEVIGPEEFAALTKDEQEAIETQVGALQERLQGILRQVPQWRKETRAKLKDLREETAILAVGQEIDQLRQAYADFPILQRYFDALQGDIVERVNEFRHAEERERPGPLGNSHGAAFRRYQVNLLVDHSESRQPPIVYEDNPTHDNLVGRTEHLAQMGALVTDFMLIKPGALHRANGGYLILDAYKVLTRPFAWEALKRALYSHEVRIESLGQLMSLISTVSLEPEPMPLEAKVVLLGDRLLYYLLCEYDPEFPELFKVQADFEDTLARTPDNTRLYAQLVGAVVHQEALRPFAREAVGRLVEHSARVVGDADKLSTHLGRLTDLMREADYWAEQGGHATVSAEDVEHAIDQQVYRADRIRQHIQEEIERGTLLIDTEGAKVAQVNGVSVIELGNFRFGHPARITATVRLGEGEVVDIEREVELGGAIHSKGVLILSKFLAARYVCERPLSLSASVVFEQSYGQVEGDSASVAELCALLSALAELPIQQSLAVTGSVSQHGLVQPIGGVNEKIEGFFDVCRARGLSGRQGVVIPAANAKHLMLRKDVVEAAAHGRFHVYTVETVDQAIELLTGTPAGERDAQGQYPPGSVNRRVEDRLLAFAELRREYVEHAKLERPGEGHD